MILTDYYKLQDFGRVKSNRYDTVCSTGQYEPFETIAAKSRATPKRFYCYLLDKTPNTFAKYQGAACMRITSTDNISRITMPNPIDEPFAGYGDAKGTTDALFFVFSKDLKTMEIFVARGRKANAEQLFYLFADGEMDDDVTALRAAARCLYESGQ